MRRKDHIKQSADLELKGHQMTERGSEINFRNCELFAIFLLHASFCIFVYFKVEIVIVKSNNSFISRIGKNNYLIGA